MQTTLMIRIRSDAEDGIRRGKEDGSGGSGEWGKRRRTLPTVDCGLKRVGENGSGRNGEWEKQGE